MTERRDFTDNEIERVWEKASIIENNNPNKFRKDYAGAWIKRSDYGNTKSEYGWEIDHIRPLAADGTYDDSNLLPTHWRNNRSKGDNYPTWETAISSEGVKNIECKQNWEYNE